MALHQALWNRLIFASIAHFPKALTPTLMHEIYRAKDIVRTVFKLIYIINKQKLLQFKYIHLLSLSISILDFILILLSLILWQVSLKQTEKP